MPFYQISLIYRHGTRKGSTETYYRQAGSAREASDLGGLDGLAPWLDLRPSATTLQAVRAQEVIGLKRVFLRLHYLPGRKNTGAPETPGVAAKLRLFSDSGSRGLEFRGLVDEQVERDGFGHDRPGPGFLPGLDRLGERIRALGLAHRTLIRNPKHQVKWYGLHPDSADLTLIQTRQSDFVPAVGSYVDLGGGGLRWLQRSRGYLVMESGPGFVAVFHPWGEVRDEMGKGKVWVRQLEHSYHTFERLEFGGFGTFATGPAYRPASWAAVEPWRTPISPCGRIVDFERVTHDGDMAFWKDDPGVTTGVRWYFPEPIPGAALGQPRTVEEIPAVPYEHPFCSRLWEQDGDVMPVLGMRRTTARNNGRPLVLLRGIGLCGSREAWETGALTTDPIRPQNPTTGHPCCCGPGALLWVETLTGGLAVGGAMPVAVAGATEATLTGGLAVGGLMPVEVATVILADLTGGVGLGGAMPEEAATVILADLTGGVGLGGEMPWEEEEGEEPPDIVTDCENCPDGAAGVYEVVIEGATGDFADQNGTHEVVHLPSTCTWEDPDFFGEQLQVRFIAGIGGAVLVRVQWGVPTALWNYESSFNPIDCLEEHEVDQGAFNADMPLTVIVRPVGGAEPTNVLLTDLAGYWPLGEASGDALAAIGEDLAENGVIGTAAGVLTGARDFEAADSDYFSHADSADLSVGDIDFSIQAWVMLESYPAVEMYAVAKGGSSDLDYGLEYWHDNGVFRFRITSGGGFGSLTSVTADTFGAVSLGVWYHLVARHNAAANEIKISVNGVTDTAAYSAGSYDSSGEFRIGSFPFYGLFWDGLICEVGFWKRYLTDEEITLLYNGGAALPFTEFGS